MEKKSSGAGSFTRRVVLLKDSDCVKHNGKIFMPTTIDMAKIKKPHTGQYNKKVIFSKSMSEEVVRQTLQKAFPLFNLTGRLYCASFGQESTAFIFHGTPCVWNGKMINKTVRGNSVLYILLEDDQTPQGLPQETNDATNSSAPVTLSNLNQPTLSDTRATVMVQNTLQLPNDYPMQEGNILNRPLAASTNCILINPPNMAMADAVAFQKINQPSSTDSSATFIAQNNMQSWNAFQMQQCSILSEELASNPDFSMTEPQNAVPADGGLDVDTMVDQWLEMADFWDSQMADDNNHSGASEIRDCRLLNQGSLFNSSEMSDSSADNHNTTSGISGLDHNLSSDDRSPREDEHFDFSVEPEKVPLQGGKFCFFSSGRTFPRNVQSALAIFENLDTVEVKRCGEDSLVGRKIPPSKTPGWVTIFLQKKDGKELGETKIWYYDEDKEAVKRIIENPKLQTDFFRNYSEMLSNRNTTTANGAEAHNSGICGSTESVQMLCVLVYAAAEIGVQQFIEMIFNTSAGRVVYDRYKDSSALPETIAREYGHEETASFLEEITGRFSKEASEAQNNPQTIDWSELVRAAEEAQKQPGHIPEEESNYLESHVLKDTGYSGDIDTSSNESCESGSSESEDNIPWATSKEMNYLADGFNEIELAHEDQKFGTKKAAVSQSLMYFCETGHFNREQVNSTASNKVALPTLEEWKLSLFQDSFIREAYGLKHQISLNRCDTFFLLGSEQESIQCHLITEYERWCLLFKYMKDSSLHSRTFAAESGHFVEHVNQETQAVMMGTSFGCVEDLCIQSTRELDTTSDNPELAVPWNSTQGSIKHSTSSDLWVLTCLYRSVRNILFVYVADNSDVLPQKAYFDDDRYELSTQYWQWQRYCCSLFDVQSRLQEMRKLSEQISPEFGPTPLPTYSAKMLPQLQGRCVSRQIECCPTWLYTIMHQCWVYAPVERPPFIAIFDGASSRIICQPACKRKSRKQRTGVKDSEARSLSATKHFRKRLSESLAESTSPTDFTLTINSKDEYLDGDWGKVLGEGLAKDTSLTAFTLTINSEHGYLGGDWGKGLGKGLAKSASLTAFTLIINNVRGYLHGDCGKSLSEGLARSTSLTAFTLIINNVRVYLHGDWGKVLGEGLAKSTALTAFTLTISSAYGYLGGDWGKGLGEGLAKSTSLTAFTLTVDNPHRYLHDDWGKGLGEGLARSTSLAAFTLIMNNVRGYLHGDWGKVLGKSLAKSTALTAFTLTINSEHGYLGGDWGKGLGEGLAKSESLTAFTLTVNNLRGYLHDDWEKGLGEGLAKSTLLTAITLSVNNDGGYPGEDWGKGLGEGLAKSASLTAFTLTIESEHGYLDVDWGKGLGESLAKSTSLTAFTLTINSEHGYLDGDWGKGLGEGLARSTSLTAFTLEINSGRRYLKEDWRKGLGEGLAKSTSLTAFTLTINSEQGYLDGDRGRGLGEGLARSRSLTAFTLTIKNVRGRLRGDWGKSLSKGLAKSTSLTAVTLTIDNVCGYLHDDWGKGLGEGLAKSTSLTAFTLTINTESRYLNGGWGKGLGEGLAKSTSLTAFTLTISSEHGYLDGDCGKGLGEGLAKSTSLTAFTLTINSKHGYLDGDWGKGLGEGLAKGTSLTAFTLTINSEHRYLGGDWGQSLSEGLAKSTSLTAFTLTINSEHGYLDGDWGKGLGEGLAKGASLTAFTLTIISEHGYLGGDWGQSLSESLAKSTALTAFTLTINNVRGYLHGDWGKGLGEGLAKSTSLTAFTITINTEHGYLGGDWGKGLGEGLARSASLTALTLTINSEHGYLHGYWGKGLGEGLAKSTSLKTFTLTINSEHGYLDGDWGKGLGEGLARSRSLTAFTLTIKNVRGCLRGDWGKSLSKGLAKSTSLTAFTLTMNNGCVYLYGAWVKGLGEGLARSMKSNCFHPKKHHGLLPDWGIC